MSIIRSKTRLGRYNLTFLPFSPVIPVTINSQQCVIELKIDVARRAKPKRRRRSAIYTRCQKELPKLLDKLSCRWHIQTIHKRQL
jgi:hypothetical protein